MDRKPLDNRVTDLEETVYGDPHDRDDHGLVGLVRNLAARETERDGVVKAARIIALLLGIAISLLALVQVVQHSGGS